MGSTAVEDLIEASSGAHFSGFHLKNTEARSSQVEHPTTSATDNVKQPFVIGVAGGAASGKTTVCDMIIEQLHDQRVVLVNQDSFYHNLTPEVLKKVHEYNFDHPGYFPFNFGHLCPPRHSSISKSYLFVQDSLVW